MYIRMYILIYIFFLIHIYLENCEFAALWTISPLQLLRTNFLIEVLHVLLLVVPVTCLMFYLPLLFARYARFKYFSNVHIVLPQNIQIFSNYSNKLINISL